MTDRLFQSFADKSLAGDPLNDAECRAVLEAPREDLLPLLSAAFRVREKAFGRRVKIHVLINAKSGLCPEDCGYCSQSSVSTAEIEKYAWLSTEELVQGAVRARESRALRYCLVASGRGPTDREIEHVAEAVRAIKRTVPLEICCSLGLLSEENAKKLKSAGVDRVNHNLNTSGRFYSEICTTHTYQDRIETIRNAKSAGLEICSGGIVGMGEKDSDIVALARAVRELACDSVPVNFLHPIPGTPLENERNLDPARCLRILCLFRLLNPRTEVRIGGGREHNLRSLQALALYPADALFVNGYLTTPGQPATEAHRMIEDMGFEVEEANQAVPLL
jgi:biotin synthase